MKCSKCGKENDNDASFCTGCGEKLVNEEKCPNCGSYLNKNSNFCTNCGFKLEDKNSIVVANNSKTRDIVMPKSYYESQKKVSVILMLITLVLGLVTTTLPIFYGNGQGLTSVPSNIYVYSILECIISNGGVSYMYLTPAIIMFISSIVIIVCAILGLVKSIQAFSSKSTDENSFKKIYYIFVIAFIMLQFTASSCLSSIYSSVSEGPFPIFTMIFLVVSFIYNIIRSLAASKENNSFNVFKIISFVLTMITFLFLINVTINYSDYSGNYFKGDFHPYGYLNALYYNTNTFNSLLMLPNKTVAFVKAWIFLIAYFGSAVAISILFANLLATTKTKHSILPTIILGVFGITLEIMAIVISASSSYFSFSYLYTGALTAVIVLTVFNIIYYVNLKKEEIE